MMINIYLNQVEKELDQLLIHEKNVNDQLRIAQDIYTAIEAIQEDHIALKTVLLFNVIKRQNELEAIQENIALAQRTIKDIHTVRINQSKERKIGQVNDNEEFKSEFP